MRNAFVGQCRGAARGVRRRPRLRDARNRGDAVRRGANRRRRRAAVRGRVVGAVPRSRARRLDRARADGRSRSEDRACARRGGARVLRRRAARPLARRLDGDRAHGEPATTARLHGRSASRPRATTPASRRCGSSISSAACAAASQAAGADADAAVADLRDAQVLVAAEVARNYVELRGAQKRLAVARTNLGYQQETLELTRVRLELGRGSELDVASAAARRAATEATIPPLVAAETIAANRLAVLLGERPGALDGRARLPRDRAALDDDRRRLAGRAAAAPARHPRGRARARGRDGAHRRREGRSFPAPDALRLHRLRRRRRRPARRKREPRVERLARAVVGRLRSRHVRARASSPKRARQAALAGYELTVLRALEETENAFVTYGTHRQRLESVVEQATASRTAAELARIQYREGALDFLRLLDAERTLLQAEDEVAAAESESQLVGRADLQGARRRLGSRAGAGYLSGSLDS